MKTSYFAQKKVLDADPNLMPISEEWRPCPYFETDYEVSSLGRMRRKSPTMGSRPGKLLALTCEPKRYVRVNLRCSDGRRRTHYVHRLICTAFHGKPPTKEHMVDHFDNDKSNNAASNLHWVTRAENESAELKPRLCGEDNPAAKLSKEQVCAIRLQVADGKLSQRKIARKYGITQSAVSAIKLGKVWMDFGL